MSENNAWAAYMENTRRTEEIQSDILRAVKEGEDPALLLIRCAQALSLVTNNSLFAQEIERSMRAVRGHVFREEPLIRDELEQTRARMERIREAMATEEDLDLKEEMDQAVRAHQRRIDRLTEQLGESENSGTNS